MTFQYFLELLGTMTFAISGALAVKDNEVDVLGASFTAFITAIGGGTLRDLLLDAYPLVWISDVYVLLSVLVGIILTFTFYKTLERLRTTLLLFDTMGIALFSVLGVEKALSLGVHPAIAVIMGMFSAIMGGVLRDTLTNRTPVLFRAEVYASPCLGGAFMYMVLDRVGVPRDLNFVISASFIASVRLLAVRYKWMLPRFKTNS